MSDVTKNFARYNELMKQMRIKNGGYICPKCGEIWNGSSNIHSTVIKGLLSTHPAWECLKCGYTWKWK